MTISVTSVGAKSQGQLTHTGLVLNFIMRGDAVFQVEISNNRDNVFFSSVSQAL